MTTELTTVNGSEEVKDKVPHSHVDGDDDNDEIEEDGAPEGVGAGGAYLCGHCALMVSH